MGDHQPATGPTTPPETRPTAPTRPRSWRRGGPLWAWPVLGIALIAIAGELVGRVGALLVAGMGVATFVLVGSELAFRGRRRLYAVGIAFAVASAVVGVALLQPVAGGRTGSPPSNAQPGSSPPQPAGTAQGVSAPPTDVRGRTVTADMLAGRNLQGADLRGAVLRGLDLRGRSLDGAQLTGASLVGARLDGASLRGTDLQGADLRRACLRRTDLRGAVLRGADAEGADARDAQLSPNAADVADRWPGTQTPADPAVCA